jgi:thiamine-phosphate pyrophosphorylase
MTKINGLYAITPDSADTARLLTQTAQILQGGAAIVQYRNKSNDSTLRLAQAEGLAALCRCHGALCLINDDVELAQQVGADGVHVGRDDAGVAEARRQLGPDAVIGVSCYNQLELAEAAVAAGASYVAFGAIYPSTVKPDAVRAPLTLFGTAKTLGVPSVAIGGINLANAAAVVEAGADAIAVISALYEAPDPKAAASVLAGLF